MWKLVIEDDEGNRTNVPLTRAQYTIGRREGNIIRLTERNVSREHARLYQKTAAPDRPGSAEAFVIEDLTSYTGVFVNGVRISHAQTLAHGDLIQIGDYRIIIQDEALAAASEVAGDSKQTVPSAPHARGATLLDRPNRLVMLAGPTPGAEFPLDRDRMTIGRAEDSNISVNHNSVSRLHCEVHAIGDGRFEIVDKGSSNGVRVNAAELRRGIIEAGDVIELGDVRFKFIGAGQIFLPTESHQLATIGDREPSRGGRGRVSNALPWAVFAVVVVAGAAGAIAYNRPRFTTGGPMAVTRSPELAALQAAQKLCAAGDCETAHAQLKAALPNASRWRDTPEFHDIESRWAEGLLARAEATGDLATRRSLYQTVSQAMGVDAPRRKIAADRLQQLDANASIPAANALELPVAPAAAAAKVRAEDAAAPLTRAERRAAREQQEAASAGTPQPSAASPSIPSGVDEHERQLALQGTQDSKIELKQHLEPRVYGGRASEAEIRLLISTCKDLGDKSCVMQAREILNTTKR